MILLSNFPSRIIRIIKRNIIPIIKGSVGKFMSKGKFSTRRFRGIDKGKRNTSAKSNVSSLNIAKKITSRTIGKKLSQGLPINVSFAFIRININDKTKTIIFSLFVKIFKIENT
jgi:hypothetical protein